MLAGKQKSSLINHYRSHNILPWFKATVIVPRYSFAIVGINLTAMAYKLLSEGAAKSHFYNASAPVSGLPSAEDDGVCTLEHFHNFYAYLFVEFDKFWYEKYTPALVDLLLQAADEACQHDVLQLRERPLREPREERPAVGAQSLLPRATGRGQRLNSSYAMIKPFVLPFLSCDTPSVH